MNLENLFLGECFDLPSAILMGNDGLSTVLMEERFGRINKSVWCFLPNVVHGS